MLFSARFAQVLLGAAGLAGSADGSDLIFTYNSATGVPVTAGSYVASGPATLALDFAPPTGTNLTVVRNTGLGFISGTFSNLAQGQEVTLGYGGRNYVFVANYYGGSGNDLVLQWANLRPVAWGGNANGQLGNDSKINSSMPVAVAQSGALADKRVIAVSAGYFHSLALCSDGTVAAWGANSSGQLGNNSTISSSVPVVVDRSGALAGKTVIAVSAGYYHSLALCSDGTVAAWGSNGLAGQLGNNSAANSSVPVAVDQSGALSGKTVITVSAGASFSVVLCSDGTLAAWGDNVAGQLGNNSRVSSSVPVAVYQNGVLAGKTVAAVSAGAGHSLALCTDGSLAAWGENYYGQLGNYQNKNTQSVPVSVFQSGLLAGRTVTAVSAGYAQSLALCSDGTLAAWGANYYGQLGNDTTIDRVVPVAVNQSGVLAGKAVVSICAAERHSSAFCSDGTVASWGNNYSGQFGNNNTSSSNVPVAATTSGLASGERIVVENSGHSAWHALALVASPPMPPTVGALAATVVSPNEAILNGTVNANHSSTAASFDYGTTNAYGTRVDATPATITGNSAIAVTATLTGLAPGTFYHFRINGVNAVGETHGTDQAFFTAGTVVFDSETDVPATADGFSASGAMNFALNFVPPVGSSLTVVNNTGMDFIKGAFSNLAQGQLVTLSYGGLSYRFVVNYHGGTGNDLVLEWANARPVAWGRNADGQLGNNSKVTSHKPVDVFKGGVLAGKRVIAVSEGTAHSLALCSDGTLAAWGSNSFGELGINSTTNSSVPVAVLPGDVLAGKRVIAISAGYGHSLALCSDSTLAAWGYGYYGQLGHGGTSNRKVPTAVIQSGVLAGKTIISVSAGGDHSLVLCSDGTMAAWGDNYHGQLGNNTATSNNAPKEVLQRGALAGKRVVAASAGREHNVALCSDGTIAAWGHNRSGQLGTFSVTESMTPLAVPKIGALSGKTVVSVSAGGAHNLAHCSDGTLAAWGSNSFGQLGNNSTTDSATPVAVYRFGVLAGKTVSRISAGYFHSLALCSDGLVAWGINSQGELGNGGTADSAVPVAVSTTGLAVGERFILASNSPSGGHDQALVAIPELKPASIAVSIGSDQHAVVNTPFGSPLSVIVRDPAKRPVGGVTVTFGAPDGGASGSFAGGVMTAVTNAAGIAHSPVFSANTVAGGPYIVTASAPGVDSIGFSLTNDPAEATRLVINAPTDATAGTALGITITAMDQFNNLATGFSGTIRFTSTDGAATLPGDYTFVGEDAGVHEFGGGVKLIRAGQQLLTVTDTVSPSIFGTRTIRVAAGAPASIVATSGTPQVVKVNTGFPLPLVATVRDVYGNPANGVSVTFAAPASGASALFDTGTSITVGTDSGGLANSGAVAANGANGNYLVTATVHGVTAPANFPLGNGTASPTASMPVTPTGGFRASSQTGLFDITVPVRNTTAFPINGFRLHVDIGSYLAAYPSLRLYNASSPAGSPAVYVDYPYPVAIGDVVFMKLSFYTRTRTFPSPFAPGLSVEILQASQVPDTNGSGVQPRLVKMRDGNVMLEFPSVAGHWYRVRYSPDMVHWFDSPVPLQAGATRMQWIDSGPPFTEVPPSAAPSRYYVVNEIVPQ